MADAVPLTEQADTAASDGLSRKRETFLAALMSLVLAALLLACLWDRTINHDTAWYLLSTREWLAGARLYVDLYDVNPPLASYLTVPALMLADAFRLGDVNGQYAFLAALTAVSTFWSWAVLTERLALAAWRRMLAFFGLAAVLILPNLYQFAQREHLMVLLVLPWFLGQLPGGRGRAGARIARAIPAGMGICLKPYFLPLPVFVTIWQVIRNRSLRPIVALENMVMLAVGIAYVAASWLLYPEYFSDVIPVAREAYASFGSPSASVVAFLAVSTAPFLPVVLLLAVGERVPSLGLFLSGSLAGLATYSLQWNGFDYHIIPFATFALLTLIWILLHSCRITPLTIAAALTLAGASAFALHRGTYDYRIEKRLKEAIGPGAQPKTLFAATTAVDAGPLLALKLGARWVSRYPQNWIVPGALRGLEETDCDRAPERCAMLGALLDRTRDDNITDIENSEPEMILIDKRQGFVTVPGFSWYELYETSPRWPVVLKAYRLSGSTATFDVWTRRSVN